MAQTLLLQNARLIDGLADQPRAAGLLVIDGDPLHDVRDLRKLTTVYRGGVAYDPQALLAQAPQSDFVPAS